MIFFHLLYSFFYVIFRKIASKYVHAAPETTALTFTSFIYGLTLGIIFKLVTENTSVYTKKVNGVVFIMGVLLFGIWQYAYYVRKEKYAYFYEKYKNGALLMLPIVGAWIYFIYYYLRYKYHNF